MRCPLSLQRLAARSPHRHVHVFPVLQVPEPHQNDRRHPMNASLKILPLAVSAALAVFPAAHAAQDNVQTLSNFKTTGNTKPAETVPQTGSRADALRENLKAIKLPPGFKIELYA